MNVPPHARIAKKLRRTGPVTARRDDAHCLAVKLANEWLDHGATLSAIFQESEGYSISARELSPRQFEIDFGCTPGPMLGDGGSWIVEFDESGAVTWCEGREVWRT